jgi:hypothetical protein
MDTWTAEWIVTRTKNGTTNQLTVYVHSNQNATDLLPDQMPAPPCCIQREAGEAFDLFLAVFALKHTALFPRNREEPLLGVIVNRHEN